MALKQPINGALINGVADVLFKCVMNHFGGDNIAVCRTFQKRREKGGFFIGGEIRISPAAGANRFEARWAESLIKGGDFRNKRAGNTELGGNGLGRSWLKHGGVNDQPTVTQPDRWGGMHLLFHLFKGQM